MCDGCVHRWHLSIQKISGCATDVSVDAHLFERIYANSAWMWGGCADECACGWAYTRKMCFNVRRMRQRMRICLGTWSSISDICLNMSRMRLLMHICLGTYEQNGTRCVTSAPMDAHLCTDIKQINTYLWIYISFIRVAMRVSISGCFGKYLICIYTV